MKLWDKGLPTDAAVEAFTVGEDRTLDLQLAPWDVVGSVAHVVMLSQVGLMSSADLSAVLPALRQLYAEANAGTIKIKPPVEDIHSEIELRLVLALGDAGLRIHTGRSRNDQVLLDIKLWLRSELVLVANRVDLLVETFLDLADRHKTKLMPGYTHLQIGMPSSFGLWFSAYAETLTDDLLSLDAAYRLADRSPLGTAAGYGSSFPLDRELTARLLGFSSVHINSMAAQLSRGKTELFAAEAIANIASTLARFCMDACLYSGQDFAFLRLPPSFTTGSSIMPHKQNPDVFELVRGHCNLLQGLPGNIRLLLANLPGGYHREYQLLKTQLFPAMQTLHACLDMLLRALPQIYVRDNILDDPKYDLLFSVEAVNKLVQNGVPFRTAYQQVGKTIQDGTYQADRTLHHTHLGSIGNLGLDRIRQRSQDLLAEMNPFRWQQAIARLVDPAMDTADLLRAVA